LAAGTTAAGHTPAAVSAALSAPVGSDGWTGQLGAQLTWMARQGVQSASLQVTPRHLGPVQVSISVRHGQASVWFGAAQPETRQALNQALPELRTMFANQGLALTDSGVSHEAPREPRRPVRPAVSAVGELGAVEEGATVGVLAGTGLVDTYA
jgi:flagellar hook-length control protein FliK